MTGASSGIGQAIVRALCADGWRVLAVARRAGRLALLAEETGCETHVADVTQDSDVQSLVGYAAGLGGVGTLIANAGVAIGTEEVGEADFADWQAMFDVNVGGTQRMIKAFLPQLRASAAQHGVADIVAMSSTAAFISYEGGGGYNAAKAGVHALLGALRLELAGEPIRVIEIAPGMVKTDEFTLLRTRGNQAKTDALYQDVENPLVAKDVADVVRYAVSVPSHVNLDLIQMKPVAQAMQYKLHRGPLRPKL